LEHYPPGMDFDQREIESLGSFNRPDCLTLLKIASIDSRHFASWADQRSGKRQAQLLRCNLRRGLELLGFGRWLLLWFVLSERVPLPIRWHYWHGVGVF